MAVDACDMVASVPFSPLAGLVNHLDYLLNFHAIGVVNLRTLYCTAIPRLWCATRLAYTRATSWATSR